MGSIERVHNALNFNGKREYMSALQLIEDVPRKLGLRSPILAVFPTKIFYLYRGRNAWHSTWVEHYSSWCMHSTLPSAKMQAEVMRGPGSTFIINELPAVALQSPVGTLVVTEINNDTPLSEWTKKYSTEQLDYGLNQRYCRLEDIIAKQTSIFSIAPFMMDPNFVAQSPQGRDGLFMLFAEPAQIIENNRNRINRRWHSRAEGTEYHLGWTSSRSRASGRSARRVADALAARLKGTGEVKG
jgi:hypothetical protein